MSSLFRTKSVEQSIADTEEPEHRLKKNLGALDLTVFGVGVIIGAGIFVLPARWRRPTPGPAIALSFVIAGARLRAGRALLRRVRLDRAGGRQRLHVHLRDLRRAGRLDHRLGPGPGVHVGASALAVGFSGYLQYAPRRARSSRSRPRSARPPTAWSTCPPWSSSLLVTGGAHRAASSSPAGSTRSSSRSSSRVVAAGHRRRASSYINAANYTPFIPRVAARRRGRAAVLDRPR